MSEPVQRIVFALLVEDGRSGAAEKSALRAPTGVRRRPPIALQPVIQVVDHQTFGIEPQNRQPARVIAWPASMKLAHHSTAARSPVAMGSANRHSTASSTAN